VRSVHSADTRGQACDRGALLAYTSPLALLTYRSTGLLKHSDLCPIVTGTVRGAIPSSLGIAWMVGMAMIMERCGMTHTLARGLSSIMGRLFPVMSPFVGLLGAFMTGSNTNSNVIFAPLQKTTAGLLGLLVTAILAAQTTGGALGSMIAPAKLIVGCCTAGLQGQEGQVLRRTLPYALLLSAVIGLIAWRLA
jgi:lactate permease